SPLHHPRHRQPRGVELLAPRPYPAHRDHPDLHSAPLHRPRVVSTPASTSEATGTTNTGCMDLRHAASAHDKGIERPPTTNAHEAMVSQAGSRFSRGRLRANTTLSSPRPKNEMWPSRSSRRGHDA